MNITVERWVFSRRNCTISVLFSLLCLWVSTSFSLHSTTSDETRSASALSYSLHQPSPVWGDCISLIWLFGTPFREKRMYFCCLCCKDLPQWAVPFLIHLLTFSHKWVWFWVNSTWVRTVGSACDAVLSYNCISVWLFTTVVKALFSSLFVLERNMSVN